MDFSEDEREAARRALAWYGGDPRRWIKGCYVEYGRDGVPVARCVSGVCGIRDHYRLSGALSRILPPNTAHEFTGDEYFSIVEWNDDPATTFADVEAALKQIAGVA